MREYHVGTDPSAPVCARCGDPLMSVVSHGWAYMAHTTADRDDHSPAIVSPPSPAPAAAPTAHIVDERGHFAVRVDRHDGRPWTLAGTTPTGRGAQYPEARARGWAEGVASARRMAAHYVGDNAAASLPIETPAAV